MRLRYKSVLIFLMLLIILCLIIGLSYHFYVKVIANKSIVVVDGNITINYMNGNKLSSKKDKYEFSVTNNSDNDIYYYIRFNKVNAKDVNYKLICTDNDINIYNKLKNDVISSFIIINGNTTHNYELTIDNNESEYKGLIKIGVETKEEKDLMFAEAVLKNNKLVDKKTAFNESAIENEGLIKTKDDNGTSYYFRGAVTNNNVTFANLKWKIIRINGDGSIRIVLNNTLDAVSAYYNSDKYSFADSLIKKSLDEWFKNNLSNYNDYIANSKFCSDTLVEDDTGFYAPYNRIILNNIPNDVCLGTTVTNKVGLLTVDEVVMAGASINENKNYYLYNADITDSYYTLSGAKYDSSGFYPFTVNSNGSIDTKTIGSSLKGVRPVINIIKNVKVTGDGTENMPYQLIIEEEK